MFQLITAIAGVFGQTIGGWIEGKKQETLTKLEIKKIEATGRVEQAKAMAAIEASYDNFAQVAMKSSWKDEYLTIVITVPFIISFIIPFIELFAGVSLAPTLSEAWKLVGTAPDWYQWVFMGIVIATFGLRWMTKHSVKDLIPGGK